MKAFKIIIPAIAFIAAAHFAYCEPGEVTTKVDSEIPDDTLSAIHRINDTLFKSMIENKPAVMMNMFVEEGRTDPKLGENVTASYERLIQLAKGTNFTILHEYLIDAKGTGPATVTLPGDGENKFMLGVESGKGLLVISLLTSTGNFKDLMLCFVYLKTKNGWQLYAFHSGIYKVGGRSAVRWYEEARDMYDKGWEVPAMQRMQLVELILRPAPFIQYDREKEIQDFFAKGAAETAKKYTFPFKATWVKGMPAIYGLDKEFNKERLVPVVVYVTKHPLNRGPLIQEEADAITSKIEKIIPGITKTSAEIGYRAFSEPPLDADKQYKYRILASKVQ